MLGMVFKKISLNETIVKTDFSGENCILSFNHTNFVLGPIRYGLFCPIWAKVVQYFRNQISCYKTPYHNLNTGPDRRLISSCVEEWVGYRNQIKSKDEGFEGGNSLDTFCIALPIEAGTSTICHQLTQVGGPSDLAIISPCF